MTFLVHGCVDVVASLYTPQAHSAQAVFGRYDVLVAEGWASTGEEHEPAEAVVVSIDGIAVANAPLGIERSDLASVTSGSRALGFRVVLALDALDAGFHEIAFAARRDGAEETFERVPILIVDPKRAEVTEFAMIDTVVRSGDTRGAAIAYGDRVHVSGWAVSDAESATPYRVFVVVDERLVFPATLGGSRPDVAARFGIASPDVGLDCELETTLIGPGHHSAFVRVIRAGAPADPLDSGSVVRFTVADV